MLDIEEYKHYENDCIKTHVNDKNFCLETLDNYNKSDFCAVQQRHLIGYTTLSDLSEGNILSNSATIIDLEFSKSILSMLNDLEISTNEFPTKDFPINHQSISEITNFLEGLGNSFDIAHQASILIINIADQVVQKLCASKTIYCKTDDDYRVQLLTHPSNDSSIDCNVHVDYNIKEDLFPTSKARTLRFLATLKGNGTILYDIPFNGRKGEGTILYDIPHKFNGTNIVPLQEDAAKYTGVSQGSIHTTCCGYKATVHSGPCFSATNRLLMRVGDFGAM